METLAKAGTLSVIGVYPPSGRFFPLGQAMNKNLTVNMGNGNHRTYIPTLVEMVEGGTVGPTAILSHIEPMGDVIAAYKEFDLRRPGWIKVELKPWEPVAKRAGGSAGPSAFRLPTRGRGPRGWRAWAASSQHRPPCVARRHAPSMPPCSPISRRP